jgi:hemolysin III
MGWLGLIAIKEIISTVPLPSRMLMFAGGLFYTGGVIFYACKRIPFNHGIWHVFVLCGSVFHFFAVLGILEVN